MSWISWQQHTLRQYRTSRRACGISTGHCRHCVVSATAIPVLSTAYGVGFVTTIPALGTAYGIVGTKHRIASGTSVVAPGTTQGLTRWFLASAYARPIPDMQ
eukprot:303229-Rhodomonas_salina.1